MKAYGYTAYTEAGKRRKGVIVAETDSHASQLLAARGLFVSELSVRDATVASRKSRSFRPGLRLGRHRMDDDLRAVFTRQVAVMLVAGMSADVAMDAIQSVGGSGAIESLAAQVKAALMEGAPLWQALDRRDAGFAPYFIASVRAGETSGDLASVFALLADHLENQRADRARLATALVYPAFVAATALMVCGLLLVNVVPEIVSMFETSGRPLPTLTRVVLGISDWIGGNWPLLVVISVLIPIAATLTLRVPGARDRFDRVMLALPLVGRFVRLGAAAQYLRTLATVISSRQTVIDAAASAAEVLTIGRFATDARRVTEAIRSGQPLSVALREASWLPPVALQLIGAGERSAKLGQMTDRAAVLVETWLQNERRRTAALLDPLLMILVGALVLVIVLAILLPIFDLQAMVAPG